jgi:hypothetical protein
MGRTALFNRVQPGGVFTISDLVAHPGDIWFVDSGIGVDAAGYGQNPDMPVATVDYAVGLATASQGDVIYVMPGHAETYAATNGFDVDKAGIKVIGLGWGANRPTFTFTNANAQVNVGAASVTLENLRFIAGVTGVVSAVQVEAQTDFTMRNCEFDYSGTTTHDFIIMLELETPSPRATIEGCRFLTEPATAGCAAAIQLTGGASSHVHIKNNVFMGDFSTTCVNVPTALCQGLMFLDNIVYNSNADETYLEAFTGTTGVIANTRGLALAATIAANAVADAMVHAENYVANTAGTVAIIRGAGGAPALDED